MIHTDALNKILSNTCPSDKNDDGTCIFTYDLCCHEAIITARVTENASQENDYAAKYEVISVVIS